MVILNLALVDHYPAVKPGYPAMEICKGGGIRPDTIHGNPNNEGYVEKAIIAGYSVSILIQANL
ncbi:MAG: hypothetical protein CMM45_05980 [Rhodospirillaceae bacterium]|nr:hypothetical protein [Rhodospirillaceae bacterium]